MKTTKTIEVITCNQCGKEIDEDGFHIRLHDMVKASPIGPSDSWERVQFLASGDRLFAMQYHFCHTLCFRDYAETYWFRNIEKAKK